LLDGENGHFGLVGITDIPFQGFVDSVRKANLQAVDQLAKAGEQARLAAEKAGNAGDKPEGEKPAHEPQGAGQGGHTGGHSGNGH
jgi:hypothetical protein